MSPLPKSRHGRGSSATPGEDRGSLRRSGGARGPGGGSFHTPVGVGFSYTKKANGNDSCRGQPIFKMPYMVNGSNYRYRYIGVY